MADELEKRPQGQPTKYKDVYVQQAFTATSRMGATIDQLAELFQVNTDTIYEWQSVHPSFSEAIQKGRDVYDTQMVERSFRNRAVGYKRTIERLTKEGRKVACVEEVPPDTIAGIFWLKNRHPERWRDKQEIEHSIAKIDVQIGQKKLDE